MVEDKKKGKEMKFTIKELIESSPSLTRVMNKELPSTASYGLKKSIKALQSELKNYHEARIIICEKHGTKIEGTENYDVPTEKESEFNKEMEELLNLEVEIPVHQITLASLKDVVISAMDLHHLDKFIVEEIK